MEWGKIKGGGDTWSSLVAQRVKDLELSLLWRGALLWRWFNPWPKNFLMPQLSQKEKTKQNKTKKQKKQKNKKRKTTVKVQHSGSLMMEGLQLLGNYSLEFLFIYTWVLMLPQTVWSWANCFPSLSLNFFICKMERTLIPLVSMKCLAQCPASFGYFF